jgi:hypothetical protein
MIKHFTEYSGEYDKHFTAYSGEYDKVITAVKIRLKKYLRAYIVLKIKKVLCTEYTTYFETSTSFLQLRCICDNKVLQI